MNFLDGIDDPEVVDALHRAEIGLASRHEALMLYGLLGVQVGLAMMFTGAQPPIESSFGLYARVWFGLAALIGGGLVSYGALAGDRTRRGWRACLVGAIIMGSWCTAMAITYTFAIIGSGVHFSWPWDPMPLGPEVGRLFVPFLYQTLALLVGLHVVTLVRMGPPKR